MSWLAHPNLSLTWSVRRGRAWQRGQTGRNWTAPRWKKAAMLPGVGLLIGQEEERIDFFWLRNNNELPSQQRRHSLWKFQCLEDQIPFGARPMFRCHVFMTGQPTPRNVTPPQKAIKSLWIWGGYVIRGVRLTIAIPEYMQGKSLKEIEGSLKAFHTSLGVLSLLYLSSK